MGLGYQSAEQVQAGVKYLYPAEVPALKALAMSLRGPCVIVNIGAGFGTSGLTFLEARPKDMTLYTVDIEDGPSPTGSLETERLVLNAAGADVIYGKRWHQIHADSKFVGQQWYSHIDPTHRFVDMVFVDGDHSYEGAAGDIKAWLPNIKAGGIIAIHDYGKRVVPPCADGPTPDPFDGVDKAVNDLLLDKYDCILQIESLIAFRVS